MIIREGNASLRKLTDKLSIDADVRHVPHHMALSYFMNILINKTRDHAAVFLFIEYLRC